MIFKLCESQPTERYKYVYTYTYIYTGMATKTISIMEDAYRLMAMEKRPKESFSDLVRRKFGKKDLMEFAGVWKDLSDKEIEEIKAGVRAVREGMDKDFKRVGAKIKNDLS